MATAQVTPGEGEALMKVINAFVETLKTVEFERRLESIESSFRTKQ